MHTRINVPETTATVIDTAYANHMYIAVGMSDHKVNFFNAETGNLARSITVPGPITQMVQTTRSDLNLLLVADATGRLSAISGIDF